MKGAPYLSLRFVWLHQLHYLALLYQDDLGVSEPGNVQGCSRDECTHTCGTTLQSLQGERRAVEGCGLRRKVTFHEGSPQLLMDHVVFLLYGENMSYRKPFTPNIGTNETVYSGGKQTTILGRHGRAGVGQGPQRAGRRSRHD